MLELGCGDGRDASDICKKTEHYLGIDSSESMIALAREKLPQGKFCVEDMLGFSFEDQVDIIFAFASFLHLNREDLADTLQRARKALSEGGVVYLSVKRGAYQGPQTVKDNYGERVFYYYLASDIEQVAEGFDMVSVRELTVGKTEWLYVILKKN